MAPSPYTLAVVPVVDEARDLTIGASMLGDNTNAPIRPGGFGARGNDGGLPPFRAARQTRASTPAPIP